MAIELTYKEMIDGINNGIFDDVHFKHKTYSHYKSCHLRRMYVKYQLIDKPVFECIELALCDDKSEWSRYYGTFKDRERVFNIKGKGRFTLREIFKDIEILDVKYHE